MSDTQTICRQCGESLSPDALACPVCQTLTHADRLEDIANRARVAAAANDLQTARSLWIEALSLLPEETRQHEAIRKRIAEIDSRMAAEPPKKGVWGKLVTILGPAALILWKAKGFAFLLLGKGKFLLLGLSKGGTFLSMLASFGVYWAIYGWMFALGIVLSIYIHEMGHVVELRRFGIPAGAPMFIPGLGAIIRLRQLHLPPVQDSRVGLAGPLYGLGAALIAYAFWITTNSPVWAAITHFGAFVNLFNLIPIWQLDGARGMRSLSKSERMMVFGLAAVLWLLTSESMLLLIALVGGFQLFFSKDLPAQGDREGFFRFAGILLALAIVGALVQPGFVSHPPR